MAFRGQVSEARRGRKRLFERKETYRHAFENTSARHILFVYSMSRAIDYWRIELKNKSDAGTILDIEKNQLRFLRYLDFKPFLIVTAGKCSQELSGRAVPSTQLAFTEQLSTRSNATLNDLQATWLPVIRVLLALTTTAIPDGSLELVRQSQMLDEASQKVRALLYAAGDARLSAFRSNMKKLSYGDNLDVLRRHIRTESVDLIYLDPPFKSGKDYNVIFSSGAGKASAQVQAFEDTWHWASEAATAFDEVIENLDFARVGTTLRSLRKFLGESDMMAYLCMMAPRLLELRRVLKSEPFGHSTQLAPHPSKVR